MTRRVAMLFAFVTVVAVAAPQTTLRNHVDVRAVFTSPTGGVIELDTRTGTLRTPRGKYKGLHDCSDDFQTCLTDDHGFAFSFFKKCNEAESYKSLRFTPKIRSVLHGHLWMIFDASPGFMFHYVVPKGIVGIYVGRTPDFDFRRTFSDRDFRLDSLDAMQYHIAGSDTVAACSD